MRVLVTGSSGFTGKHLMRYLSKYGHEVHALTSNLTDYNALKGEILEVKPEAVIHLAGIAAVGHENIDDFYNINILGTRNLLASLAYSRHQILNVVVSSSAHVYGNKGGGSLSENSKIVPGNDYSVSKYAMELMAGLWKEDLPITITRPFNYTGKGQSNHFIIPKIVEHFRNRKSSISLGNIMLYREFGDVRDVVEIYRRFIEKPPVGETVNLCTSEPTRLRDIIDICSNLTRHEIEVKINQQFVRDNEPEKLIGDDSKLRELIPDLKRKTLTETLSWMLS